MIKLAGIVLGFFFFLVIVFFFILTPTVTVAGNQTENCARPPDPTQEPATAEDVDLDTQQVANARLILGIAAERTEPKQAGIVGVTTALQESSLRNIDYVETAGPDSRGLFQQRPQFYPGVNVMDPKQATNAFFDRLTLIDGWETMPVIAVAQQVQNSADPNAYAKWEPVATSLANQYWNSADNPTECLALIQPAGNYTRVEGIKVDANLAPNLQQLLTAARADGIDLDGWGWRDPAQQIQLRIKYCGGNNDYAIYEKPSGECRPPTARPGHSQHEVGLAIDFKDCSSRTTACYQWLKSNASQFGLINLPSEPWHWSTTGL